MAMSGGGGPRNSLSEINVTPLVDVMLVLLVVFMVTTPVIVDEMKARKIEVNVPKVDSEPLTAEDKGVAILNVHLDRKITIQFDGGQESSPLVGPCAEGEAYDACLTALTDKLAANKNLEEAQHVLIQADRNLPYGYVADVMNRVRKAGITRLGMVTNPPGAPDAVPAPGGEP